MRSLVRFSLFLFPTLSIALFLCCTRFGVGVTPDSVYYCETARSILTEGRVSFDGQPLTHYPPLYPALLAVAGSLGSSVLASARWLHVAIYLANIVAVGFIVSRLCASSAGLTALGLSLFCLSRSLLEVQSMALSEAPFLLCALLSFLFLISYRESGRSSALVGASAAIGAALMTRYVGITLLPPAILIVVLDPRKSPKTRAVCAATLTLGAITPLALWLMRNLAVAGSATNRTISFHPVSRETLQACVETIARWVVPVRCPFVLATAVTLAVASGLVALLVATIVRDTRDRLSTIYIYFPSFFFVYLSFLLVSISFVDPTTPLDERILSPLHVFGLIAVTALIWDLAKRANPDGPPGRRAALYVLLACLTTLLTADALKDVYMARRLYVAGWPSGFSNRRWRGSIVLDRLRMLPAGTPIYANHVASILLLLDREVHALPCRPTAARSRADSQNVYWPGDRLSKDYEADIARMSADAKARHAVFVLFNHLDDDWPEDWDDDRLETIGRIGDRLRCKPSVLVETKEGVVYRFASRCGSSE